MAGFELGTDTSAGFPATPWGRSDDRWTEIAMFFHCPIFCLVARPDLDMMRDWDKGSSREKRFFFDADEDIEVGHRPDVGLSGCRAVDLFVEVRECG